VAPTHAPLDRSWMRRSVGSASCIASFTTRPLPGQFATTHMTICRKNPTTCCRFTTLLAIYINYLNNSPFPDDSPGELRGIIYEKVVSELF
jgi:hypothetical protein